MTRKIIVLIFAMIYLTSCGSDNSSPGSSLKSIFSMWTSEDNQSSFDLSGGSFGSAFNMQFLLTAGEICQCIVVVNGDEAEGTITVNNCTYQGGGSGDPNCDTVLGNNSTPYDYTKSGTNLQLCYHDSSCEGFD